MKQNGDKYQPIKMEYFSKNDSNFDVIEHEKENNKFLERKNYLQNLNATGLSNISRKLLQNTIDHRRNNYSPPNEGS